MSDLSCFVVGNGAIPLSCLEILAKNGWQILGVYSTDNSLKEWSQARDIFHTSVREAFQSQLLDREYDYLFSINNTQWIVPVEIFTRARKASINFHDSPLPRYAGLYATSWALLHGETEHAVTWHEITDGVDTGRIFKQQAVPILPDDTAFTLNQRCFIAAVDSFDELTQELAAGQVIPYQQDLERRTYFGPTDRPAASSLLSFDASTQEIGNLVRSLEFGLVRNQMGIPKVWFPGGVVAVGVAEPIEMFKDAPAQILYLDAQSVYVSTIDGVVRLQEFTTLEGRQLTIADLVADYGVRVGEMLPILDRATRDAITERNAAICRFETAWEKSLLQLAPFEHPYLSVAAESQVGKIHRHPIASDRTIAPASLLTIFAAYCARIATDPEFDLGLQTDAQRSVAPEIFAQRVPLRVTTQPQESFAQFRERLEVALARVNRLGSYRRSLVRRYLELHDRLVHLPVAIVSATSPDRLEWQHLGATLAFVTYDDGSAPEVIHGGALAPERAQAIVSQLQTLIPACLEHPDLPLDRLPLLDPATQQQVLGDWNQTTQPFASHLCIHQLFEQQAQRTPKAIAVVARGKELTYQQLDERANQLAHYLRSLGVGSDVLVGLHIDRSVEMMVGLLGIHKAGGAYVPLDPDFPRDRIAMMLEDAGLAAIVTQQSLKAALATPTAIPTIAIDTQWDEIARQPATAPESGVESQNLSYVIYTSGSTGKPKGVMVEHRNVANFFTGMDAVIDRDAASVWLAVTSLSFDISVLELCWTLARGFKVVIYDAKAERARARAPQLSQPNAARPIDFSLFYFSSNEEGEATQKYRLLLEGAQFADERGFTAVWTPERHFHAFGGLFPNAAVTSAAIAATTKRIQIRAGSCVSPLHSSIRIAEDWAVVDNLSGGRVGISFAAGWQPNDFVLRPETFDRRKDIMFEQIEEVRALWQGKAVTYPNGKGEDVAVKTLPRPIQAELPIWITAAGNPETFRLAGAKGFNILTHLLGQSLEELAAKIAIYRQAWAENGHRGRGTVTLMMHTFVGDRNDIVKEIVRQPMRQYLGSSLDLIQQAAWSFPTFKQKTTSDNGKFSTTQLSDRDLSEILDFSFERYFETSGLFGTVETCLRTIDRLKGIDVNEIGCLIDYGLDTETVLNQLPLLDEVKRRSNLQSTVANDLEDYSIAGLMQQHRVTHLQCTPSMASMLLADPSTEQALGRLQHMMVGGEALSETLAHRLHQTIAGKIHNMYGPTETTIWSATHTLTESTGIVPLGRPIANTELYILDRHQQPVPVGIAGELLIGGSGVTRGYLNRTELTRERFVPNPFSSDPTARLYRTGDLVRYRTDGCLEFLGRMDFQVKVRGYRIELGEIETMLTRHPAVQEAIAIVREDLPGDKRIVAYLLPAVGHHPTSAELRSYLRSVLPEYMIPSSFIELAAFPLTPNQKIDRQALPAPQLVETPAPPAPPLPTPHQVETVEPPVAVVTVSTDREDIEQNLIAIWQKVLQIPQVSPEDNFFNLGGNSLVAMTLIGEMRQTFDVELPLISLFRAPTIAEMEREICQLQK